MASNIKPLKLYGGGHSPNPAKIAMIMDELQVPYETIAIPFTMVKEDNYTTINPNGRLPAIEDPNKGLFLWESGAIVEYLVSEYDSSNKLSFTAGSIEDYHTKQWLYFQVSGQGPYYGQYYWFRNLHPEKVPSALTRYANEIARVTSVLDKVLTGKTYLVGEKCTYADLAFIHYQYSLSPVLPPELDIENAYPNVQAWMNRMMKRPVVAAAIEENKRRTAEAHANRK